MRAKLTINAQANERTVSVQEKSRASVITPDTTGPVKDPKLRPKFISPATVPYVCTESLG